MDAAMNVLPRKHGQAATRSEGSTMIQGLIGGERSRTLDSSDKVVAGWSGEQEIEREKEDPLAHDMGTSGRGAWTKDIRPVRGR